MNSLKIHTREHTHTRTHAHTHSQDRDQTKTRGSQPLPEVNTKHFAMATNLSPGPGNSPYGLHKPLVVFVLHICTHTHTHIHTLTMTKLKELVDINVSKTS